MNIFGLEHAEQAHDYGDDKGSRYGADPHWTASNVQEARLRADAATAAAETVRMQAVRALPARYLELPWTTVIRLTSGVSPIAWCQFL